MNRQSSPEIAEKCRLHHISEQTTIKSVKQAPHTADPPVKKLRVEIGTSQMQRAEVMY